MSRIKDSIVILSDSYEEIEVVEESCAQNDENSENTENTEVIKKTILKNVDMLEFIKELFSDEQINKFLSYDDIQNMYAHRIGVEGLLRAFDKEAVCEKITWDYIREYFLDHINFEDILNHIGWEVVSNHFKDYIESETPKENINSNESILEKLNDDEGED